MHVSNSDEESLYRQHNHMVSEWWWGYFAGEGWHKLFSHFFFYCCCFSGHAVHTVKSIKQYSVFYIALFVSILLLSRHLFGIIVMWVSVARYLYLWFSNVMSVVATVTYLCVCVCVCGAISILGRCAIVIWQGHDMTVFSQRLDVTMFGRDMTWQCLARTQHDSIWQEHGMTVFGRGMTWQCLAGTRHDSILQGCDSSVSGCM